jgi:hypothetical protein
MALFKINIGLVAGAYFYDDVATLHPNHSQYQWSETCGSGLEVLRSVSCKIPQNDLTKDGIYPRSSRGANGNLTEN